MTKTLTEQWKDGTIPDGYYYVKSKWSGKIETNDFFDGCSEGLKEEYIKEVIAPVPSYDVWKNIHEQWKVAIPQIERLEKQLAISTKALKEIHDCTDWADNAFIYATEALKEIEGVE